MPIFTQGDRALLFIHVPKTGGAAIERLLVESGWAMSQYATANTEGPTTYPLRRCSPQHYHAALLKQLFHVGEFDLRFMLVREPIARFRSEYAFRRRDDSGSADLVSAWANDLLDRLPRRPYLRDNHLRAQHEFVVRDTEVYRFEDGLGAIASDLNERFDLGLDATVRHVRHKRGAQLQSRNVEVDPALEARLRDVYARDYTVFGYDGARPSGARPSGAGMPPHRLRELTSI